MDPITAALIAAAIQIGSSAITSQQEGAQATTPGLLNTGAGGTPFMTGQQGANQPTTLSSGGGAFGFGLQDPLMKALILSQFGQPGTAVAELQRESGQGTGDFGAGLGEALLNLPGLAGKTAGFLGKAVPKETLLGQLFSRVLKI